MRVAYAPGPSWYFAIIEDKLGSIRVDVNAPTYFGTPLEFAIRQENSYVVFKLLEMGANVCAPCGGCKNAMLYAATVCPHVEEPYYYDHCCRIRKSVTHAYHMPSRLSATAWCLREMGGVWPDIVQTLVQERMPFSMPAIEVEEEEESDEEEDSGEYHEDDSN